MAASMLLPLEYSCDATMAVLSEHFQDNICRFQRRGHAEGVRALFTSRLPSMVELTGTLLIDRAAPDVTVRYAPSITGQPTARTNVSELPARPWDGRAGTLHTVIDPSDNGQHRQA